MSDRRGVFHDAIAARAYDRYEARGRTGGQALDDWVEAEKALAGGRTFRLGILIIGSLIWDPRAHREQWRRNRLDPEAMLVRAPIRYGRLSDGRENTYTMVFSNELNPDRLGSGLLACCLRRVSTTADLSDEAQALWVAERAEGAAIGPISATWGVVGLLCNPNVTGHESILTGWKNLARQKAHYRNFGHALRETPAVDSEGMLTIPWPTTAFGPVRHIDFLLATATQPDLVDGEYPDAGRLVKAWLARPAQAIYFHENRRLGITTVDDQAIAKGLGNENLPA